ncbi:Uncharacterised protein [Vibrio cholerae]|nr:Uncharacterised protein [Vibrio cholerae]
MRQNRLTAKSPFFTIGFESTNAARFQWLSCPLALVFGEESKSIRSDFMSSNWREFDTTRGRYMCPD